MNYQTLTPELLEQLTAIAPGRVFAGSDINEDYSHDEMPIYGKATPRLWWRPTPRKRLQPS